MLARLSNGNQSRLNLVEHFLHNHGNVRSLVHLALVEENAVVEWIALLLTLDKLTVMNKTEPRWDPVRLYLLSLFRVNICRRRSPLAWTNRAF